LLILHSFNRSYSCELFVAGTVPYRVAWEWQRSLVNDRKADSSLSDVLILLEHPSIYTLGQGADLKHLKFDPANSSHDLVRIERGGEVTYHCPGQLVGYPILNLSHYHKDLHWYLRQLEEVLIRVLAVYDLKGTRIPGLTGVWVKDRKVAAIGIKVSKWITMHGFALNVCPDLSGFEPIVPCGIEDKSVGSLEQFIPTITMANVQAQVIQAFSEVFQVRFVSRDLPSDRIPLNPGSAQSRFHLDLE
jgi:lipoyl(octanoyl) transferase